MLKFARNLAWLGSIAAVSAISVSLLPSGTAMAQESAAGGIEEIVVTARKRAESLLEIPESVSVITGADIDRQQIKGLEDVGFQVPNLNLSMRLDGFPNVSVRGLGAFGNTQGVGFYLDDVQHGGGQRLSVVMPAGAPASMQVRRCAPIRAGL